MKGQEKCLEGIVQLNIHLSSFSLNYFYLNSEISNIPLRLLPIIDLQYKYLYYKHNY